MFKPILLPLIDRYAGKGQLAFNWDEESHPRETTSHDGKRPGEFAKKDLKKDLQSSSSDDKVHGSLMPKGVESKSSDSNLPKGEEMLVELDKKTFRVEGDTFKHKDAIKASGAKWTGAAWFFTGDNASANVAKVKDLEGVMVVSIEEEARDSFLKAANDELAYLERKGKDTSNVSQLIKKASRLSVGIAWRDIASRGAEGMDDLVQKAIAGDTGGTPGSPVWFFLRKLNESHAD